MWIPTSANQTLWASVIKRLLSFSAAPASTRVVYAGAARHTPVIVTHVTCSALSCTRRIEAKCHGTEWGAVWTLVMRVARSRRDDFGSGPAGNKIIQARITNFMIGIYKFGHYI